MTAGLIVVRPEPGNARTVARLRAGGGDVLAYTQMVERVLEALPRPARLYQVPPSLFGLALTTAQRLGRLRSLNTAALQRMRDDLVFDLEPARRDCIVLAYVEGCSHGEIAERTQTPSTAGALPYQLVKANPAMGSGALTGVTYIQRVNLTGGVAPANMACTAANKGQKTTVPYQADYIFYKAA